MLHFVNKKYKINCKILASRPKQKFYHELDKGEESILGNRFIDRDDIDDNYELENESDSNEAENETDATEIELRIEQMEEVDVDMENIVNEKKKKNTK